MIVLPDVSRTDGVAHAMLLKIKTDLPILLLSRDETIDFNEEVLSLAGKPFVVVDYIENGWDVDFNETLIVGKNTDQFTFLEGEGWQKLHQFLRYNPPTLYLKRELLLKDATEKLKPIEYPNWQPSYTIQTKEEFNSRPISVFNYWGRSHESRLIVHGEIWKHSARKGYAVCDNVYYVNHFMQEEKNANKWISLWMPHYARIDITELLKLNGMSKLSISLPGCGIKCFRSTGEAIVNSVMVMPEDNLAYSHPFEHGFNCIKFKTESVTGIDKEWPVIEAIAEALQNENLYSIYLESLKAAEWYQVDSYIKNYLEPLINKI